jgi:putative membrane-bound dehydrogenase-like protein
MSAATNRLQHDVWRRWWLPLSAVLLALAATVSPAPGVRWLSEAVGVRWLSEAVGQQPDEDSIQRDYSTELTRTMPLSPEQALASFQVADGFEIQLVAAEPLVTDPIAMAFDENGRLFVVEMRDYSEHGDEHLGRIRLLRDHDGDGRYDQSTLFAEDLSWPTAIACYDGGIFVAAAPDIWYFKDQDDDGRADERRRVFTGFGRNNVQGLVNSFQWGLDLRIHGATSSCGATLTRVDSPPTPAIDSATDNEQQPLVLRGRDFSFDPRTLDYQATSGGGQHGMSFDDWGRKFVCSNSDHLQQVMFEDRYLARNPYLAAPQARVSIAEDRGWKTGRLLHRRNRRDDLSWPRLAGLVAWPGAGGRRGQ